MAQYDVVVVGGGPVGSHTAAKLAAAGLKIAVLERRAVTGGKPCTGIVSSDCVRQFDIPEDVILRRVNSATLFSPSGRMVHLKREKTQAVIVDRSRLEQFFVERARSNGASYLNETFVSDIQVEKTGVRIDALQSGRAVEFSSKMVVLAAGFNPKLNERLGLGKPADFAIGAQAEVSSALDETEVYFGKDVAPGFFGWLVPTSPGKALVGTIAREHVQNNMRTLLGRLAEQGKIASAEVLVTSTGIPLKPPRRSFGDRLLAVGDAAGQLKPTTCGGIFYGLLCADLAAETALQGFRNSDLSARTLSGYEQRWHARLKHELEVDYRARQFFERLTDRRLDHLFELIASHHVAEELMGSEELSFDWHSSVILRLAGHHVISHALDAMKMPFKLGRRQSTHKN